MVSDVIHQGEKTFKAVQNSRIKTVNFASHTAPRGQPQGFFIGKVSANLVFWFKVHFTPNLKPRRYARRGSIAAQKTNKYNQPLS
jgi:hypothetical protein